MIVLAGKYTVLKKANNIVIILIFLCDDGVNWKVHNCEKCNKYCNKHKSLGWYC